MLTSFFIVYALKLYSKKHLRVASDEGLLSC